MNRSLLFLLLAGTVFSAEEDVPDAEDIKNKIKLDETAIANLKIETEVAELQEFETTVFAIGRIEEIPSKHSVLSSRIPGRIVGLKAFEGDYVEQGQVLALVESRQPGNPPPTIELKAPQAGLIINSHVRLGEPVEPDKELLDISDRSTMWAVAKVPENAAAQIKSGSKARIRVPALGEKAILATMLRYGTTADRQSGTIEAIFELENSEKKLQPGMRAEFSLIISSRPDILAVPREAVQGPPSKRVVFVEDFNLKNVFSRAPVVLGEQNDEYVEVVSGLLDFSNVVTRGAYSLSFTTSGGMTLKEYMDASHGHEHAEDGSELTDEQKKAKAAEAGGHSHDHESEGPASLYLKVYAVLVTLLFLAAAQLVWRGRKTAPQSNQSV